MKPSFATKPCAIQFIDPSTYDGVPSFVCSSVVKGLASLGSGQAVSVVKGSDPAAAPNSMA